MGEKRWTPQQADAINARGGTVLVSAAAGSGKTAVLVERVIGRILDETAPVDADRLLIATFSNAAALEMKQRIAARIGALLAENPEDTRLQRQQVLLARAQIGTIHAFCSGLIRANFQQLSIPSNIRVADEKELVILRRQCASRVMEQFHEEDGGRFSQLVELLSAGRDDSRVFSTLFTLYDFVRAHPFYNQWLDEKLLFYSGVVRVEDSIWGKCILDYAGDALGYAIEMTQKALEMIDADEKMTAAYHGAYAADLTQLTALLALVRERRWDRSCEMLDAFTFEKLRPLKGDGADKANVQALRAGVKKLVGELRERQFCATAAEFAEDIAFLQPMVETLFALVKAFDKEFSAAKLQKSMMDFSDMEQYAIALLVKPKGGGFLRTELAEAISAEYDEVLIDEFQDTNAAQELVFRAVSRLEKNLFLVGDVKQSIYRFRQACPELFMEKKLRYAPYDGEHFPAKIILGKNFRSAPEITGAINFFFSHLMSEKVGEIDYNEEEQLLPGAVFPAGRTAGCSIRLLDSTAYAGQKEKTALEADYVAEEIAGLLERGETVSEGEALRRVRPSDICVLLRSPSSKAQVYQEALAARGVPVWAEPKSGFLTTREVAPVLALLRVLGNPLREIDLAAAMMSALFGFTADEMAAVRLTARREPLYLAVLKRAQEGDAHCVRLIDTLTGLRRYASAATADQVIRRIYELCDYMGKVQVMRMGQARRANLLLLVQYACTYHQTGYKGLSGFVGFVDRLLEVGGDFSPAATLSEQADVVRIMSIHRSKGLEFPVVFLCDAAKRFNREDLNGNTLLHSELGFACVRRDFELMKQFTTVPMQALKLEIERSMLSEELRVLYVALTRAKERLILTGVVQKPGERMAALLSALEPDGKLPSYLVRGAGSYLDWLLMAAGHHPDLAAQLSAWGLTPPLQTAESSRLELRVIPVRDGEERLETPPVRLSEAPDEALDGELERRIAWRYPFLSQTKIPTKMAVSQLSKGAGAESYRFAGRPAFLSEQGLTGAQRGNALHKFMQFSDYAKAAADLPGEVERLAEAGFLSRQEADAIDLTRLRGFFESRLAARIFGAQKVYRELRFLAEAGRELLGEYTDLFDGEGKTAVQGVADCVFIEDGQAVVVDYKSDRVKDADALVERYRVQLTLYRKLLGEALGVPVKECVLYSFALSKAIPIA